MVFFCCQKVNAELSKVKLQFKSKVASLTSQLAQSQKTTSESVERVCVILSFLVYEMSTPSVY